jgi:hypothetical protein
VQRWEAGARTRIAMKNLSDFALEQHRVYVLRHFDVEPGGSIICSAYARSNPEKIITARFPQAVVQSSWQEHDNTATLPWPLEVISFHAVRLGRRFRFTLNCVDFQREWESDWPQLI